MMPFEPHNGGARDRCGSALFPDPENDPAEKAEADAAAK
jgi:hypothetical protein